MGVPGFFLWLWKKYKSSNFVFSKKNIPDIDKPIIDNIDYVLLDMNCMIHPVCFDTLKELDLKESDMISKEKLERIEKKMMQNVIIYLEKTLEIAMPRKGIYLAIDGVAPVAKMKQQRLRRYKSINDKELFDKIRKKHKKDIPFFWSNSAITPGTIFMENLTKMLNDWIVEYKKKNDLEIIFSSSDIPSEGEHKLLQFIRENQKTKSFNYVIYGLDADLIFLMLTTGLDNIYLMREENNMEHKKTENNDVSFNFVSIRTMKQCIYSSMCYNNNNINNLIDDFIFICYLMGNDFLPHIPALDIYSGAIDKLLKIYVESFNENKCYIIDRKLEDYINSFAFFSFLIKLAETEELSIIENYGKKKKKSYCSSTDPFDIEMHKIDNMNFKINDPIMLGNGTYKEWRTRFYQHYYHTELTDIDEFSKKMAHHYMIGLKWVTIYYFDKCPAWDWFYPFDHAPFLNDMIIDPTNINYFSKKSLGPFKLSTPLTPYEQLLTVLPKESNYLLPLELRKIMLNPNSSVAHLYPTEFQLDLIGKKKYWMAHPILPMLEINLIRKMYEKYSKLLNK